MLEIGGLSAMHVPANAQQHIRFGPFTVDVVSRELWNDSQRVPLQEKPFQVLLILLERPGELVTREELQHRLWADAFVDSEHGINVAVGKLREALGDDSEQPRFVETLPRRGYRFIPSTPESPAANVLAGPRISQQAEFSTETKDIFLRRRKSVLLLVAAAVGVVGILLFALRMTVWHDQLGLHSRSGTGTPFLIQSLAVLPFENLSGDPSNEYFADGFTDELITQLAEQGPVRVVSRTSVMRYKGSRKPLPEIARELNVDAIVEGSVSLSERQVRITAQLIEASSDRHLWAHSYNKDRKDLLSVQSELAATITSLVRANTDSKHAVVLSDFDNRTGDGVFDDALKQGLAVQLEQSPYLDLVSERRVNETLELMGRPGGSRLTLEITRELCRRTGTNAMVTGSIQALGSQYVIAVKAMNCNTGDVLAETQEQAAGKEMVLKALGAAALSLRSKLGESLSSVQKYATPLEEATTPSLEALRAYSLGRKANFTKGNTAALSFYKRAVELDPNFAMPYAAMSIAYNNLNEAGRQVETGRKAYELRQKVSERERLFIEGTYYLFVSGELEKAEQVYESWAQIYPRDDVPHRDLGVVAVLLGDWDKALEEWREALRLDPNNAANYLNLGGLYVILDRPDEAEAVYKRAEDRKLESETLLLNRYQLAFLKGDTAQMAQMFSAAIGRAGTEDLLLAAQADTEAWHGGLKKARQLTGSAVDSAQRNDAQESAAVYEVAAALREVESGNTVRASAMARAALKLAPNREVREVAALVLARSGDVATAEKLITELDKSFPVDTLVQRYWLPTLRAAVALSRNNPSRAVEILKISTTTERGSGGGTLNVALCPAYLRGEAYLMLHDGNRAASEFEKFIRYGRLVVNFPWGAVARVQLARAYVMQGDAAKARTAYQDFFNLWKDADPDIPVLKQGKVEYAKLR